MNRIGGLLVLLALVVSPASLADDAVARAAEILAQVSQEKPRTYSTRDFGRENYAGAASVLVPEQQAPSLLKKLRTSLPKGFVAFIGTQRSLAEPPAKGVEVVVGPGSSQFDILRIAASDAVNYGKETEDLIAVLQGWDRRFGIDIYAAETDTIILKLKVLPKDLDSFGKEVYEFCPDIVDQGVGTVKDLVTELRKSREVYLWWD